jgi:hypothetical protein
VLVAVLTQEGIMRNVYGALLLSPDYIKDKVPFAEAVAYLQSEVREKSGEELHIPSSGRSRQGFESLIFGVQSRHAWIALATTPEPLLSPYEAYMLGLVDLGEPVALSPIQLVDENPKTYTPTLSLCVDGQWLVGNPRNLHRYYPNTAEFADVLPQAFALTDSWRDKEQEQFQAWLKESSAKATPTLYHALWELTLAQTGICPIDDEVVLEKWGNHGTYALVKRDGGTRVVLASSPKQAVGYAYLLLRNDLPSLPPVGELVKELLRGEPVSNAENGYRVGQRIVRGQRQGNQVAIVTSVKGDELARILYNQGKNLLTAQSPQKRTIGELQLEEQHRESLPKIIVGWSIWLLSS